MATLEDRVTALEVKVEQLTLFDQMASRIVEVVQQQGREAMHAIADLGEQHDHFEAYVRGELTTLHGTIDTLDKNFTTLREELTTLHGKFDTHTVLLHRILKRLGDE